MQHAELASTIVARTILDSSPNYSKTNAKHAA